MRSVTIIVPAKNEERRVEASARSIIEARYPLKEIIFVDDGSSDGTGRILKKYEGKIKIIRTEGIGPGMARNLAAKDATGEIIAFTDADCVVDKDWITNLVRNFEDEEIFSTGGIQLVPKDESGFGRKVWDFFLSFSFVSDYVHTEKGIKEVRHSPTCNAAYRKEGFNALNGFRGDLWPCEDLEFDIRARKAGLKQMLDPGARVYHYRPDTHRGFLRMLYRYGRAHSRLNMIHGFTEVVHYIPLAVAAVVFLNILSLYRQSISILYFDAALILALFTISICRVRGMKRALYSLVLLAGGVASWTLGYVNEYYRKFMG